MESVKPKQVGALRNADGKPSEVREVQVFLCYRRPGGDRHARTLHRQLDGLDFRDADGAPCRLRVYFDQTAPAVADWKAVHLPSLQTSGALVLICTEGVCKDFSRPERPDWVYQELGWWLENRGAAPIVVDTTGDDRYLPEVIQKRWPDINRVPFVEDDDWAGQVPDDVSERIREQIVGAIRESEHKTVFENLKKEKKQERMVRTAFWIALLLLFVVVVERLNANRERENAKVKELSSASYILSDRDPTISLRFAEKSARRVFDWRHPIEGHVLFDTTAELAALRAFNRGSWLYSHRHDEAVEADLAEDGSRLAWLESDGFLHLESLNPGNMFEKKTAGSFVRFAPSGNLVIWSSGTGAGVVGHIEILTPSGDQVAHDDLRFREPVLSSDGTVMIPSFKDNDFIVEIINSTSGSKRVINFGRREIDFGLETTALPDGTGLVGATVFPGRFFVAYSNGRKDEVEIESGYHATDIAVDRSGSRAAVYLSAAKVGISDAVGWYDLKTPEFGALKIVSLKEGSGRPPGGFVRFLPDGRVIAIAREGWAMTVSLATEAIEVWPSVGGASEVVEVSSGGVSIFVARRSGTVDIYDSEGRVLGALLGHPASDGSWPAFERLVCSKDGTTVLTVSRSGIRIWRRPGYQVVVTHDFGKVLDGIPLPVLAQFQAAKGAMSDDRVKVCKDLRGGGDPTVSDRLGILSLCVKIGDRTEYLSAGVTAAELGYWGSRPVPNIGYLLLGFREDRLFVLSPVVIRSLVGKESRAGRLWVIDEKTEGKLIESNR